MLSWRSRLASFQDDCAAGFSALCLITCQPRRSQFSNMNAGPGVARAGSSLDQAGMILGGLAFNEFAQDMSGIVDFTLSKHIVNVVFKVLYNRNCIHLHCVDYSN